MTRPSALRNSTLGSVPMKPRAASSKSARSPNGSASRKERLCAQVVGVASLGPCGSAAMASSSPRSLPVGVRCCDYACRRLWLGKGFLGDPCPPGDPARCARDMLVGPGRDVAGTRLGPGARLRGHDDREGEGMRCGGGDLDRPARSPAWHLRPRRPSRSTRRSSASSCPIRSSGRPIPRAPTAPPCCRAIPASPVPTPCCCNGCPAT